MNATWNLNEPPKDGTPIVAVGRIIWHDLGLSGVDRLIGEVRWKDEAGGVLGWHYCSAYGTELSVARTLGDEVKLDYWMPLPGSEASK